MKIYAAYGSNMHIGQMELRCPGAKIIGKGTVPYRLMFHGLGKGVADIVPDKRCKTPVVIWEIDEMHEEALDRYEGYPRLYVKENVPVTLEDGSQVQAMAYVMTEPYKVPTLPHQAYFNVIRRGYIDNGIEVDILKTAWHRVYRQIRRRA